MRDYLARIHADNERMHYWFRVDATLGNKTATLFNDSDNEMIKMIGHGRCLTEVGHWRNKLVFRDAPQGSCCSDKNLPTPLRDNFLTIYKPKLFLTSSHWLTHHCD